MRKIGTAWLGVGVVLLAASVSGAANGQGGRGGGQAPRSQAQSQAPSGPFSCMVESTQDSLYFNLTNTSGAMTNAGMTPITICHLRQPNQKVEPCSPMGAMWVYAAVRPNQTFTIRTNTSFKSASKPTCSAGPLQ